MEASGGVLVIDDDPSYLRALRRLLEGAGISPVETLPEGRDALEKVSAMRPDLVCLDLNLGEMDGREILSDLRARWPGMGVVVVSGNHDTDIAMECIRSGASDFVPKPFLPNALLQTVNRIRGASAAPPSETATEESPTEDAFADILTVSPRMHRVFRYATSVARSSLPILVTGESGTGKELMARALHQLRIPDGPFVAVNTAGLDDSMFTDTLFGHLGGSFTGGERPRAGLVEEAGEGTLFLDEIGDLSPASQVKLLRLLQESEYFPIGSDRPKRSRCRFVVATHRDLARTPGFRRDLYWRLQAHPVRIPPLRERSEDIPVLFRHFVRQAAHEMCRRHTEPDGAFLAELSRLDFPGNIRELRGLAYDLVARDEGFRTDSLADSSTAADDSDDEPSTFPTLSELESRHILLALRKSGGNRTAAAELLGISRQTLLSRLKKSDPSSCPDP